MKLTKLLTIITLLTTLLMGAGFAAADSKGVVSGLTDFNNTPKTIEDFTGKGKWLLVMFWASSCHICNREAHEYVDFHFAHSDKDATVLGISIDGRARLKEAKKFIKKHSIDFPNLIGEPEVATAIYSQYANSRWVGTPSFLLFNPQGELQAAQAGAVPPENIENFIKKNTPKPKAVSK